MNCNLWRDDFETIAYQVDIFLNTRKRLVVRVEIFHLRAFHNVEKVELHAEEIRDASNVAHGIEHHVAALTREPEDEMDNGLDAASRESRHRFVEHAEIIAAVYRARGLLVDGLKAELDPQKMRLVDLFEKVEHLRREAVWTRADYESANLRICKGFRVFLAEFRDGCICVRVVLEIGEV